MKKANEIITQLQSVGNVLVGQGYDFVRQGNVFTFTTSNSEQIVVTNSFDGNNYTLDIVGPLNSTSHTHHKVIDTSYFSYMLRRVKGTINYTG
jgi:hypothetical protein